MSAPTRTTFTPGETETKRHPIRGFLWGLIMGIGLAVVAIIIKVMTMSLVNIIILVAIGVVFGVVWGLYGPAKAPKGPPPAARTAAVHEPSRFDDFDKAPVQDDTTPNATAGADDAGDSTDADGGGDD